MDRPIPKYIKNRISFALLSEVYWYMVEYKTESNIDTCRDTTGRTCTTLRRRSGSSSTIILSMNQVFRNICILLSILGRVSRGLLKVGYVVIFLGDWQLLDDI